MITSPSRVLKSHNQIQTEQTSLISVGNQPATANQTDEWTDSKKINMIVPYQLTNMTSISAVFTNLNKYLCKY